MQYFIRFVQSEEYAKCDLERGFSFVDYNFFDSAEDVVEFYALEDADDVAQHDDGRFGVALNGLCGFGPFETIEEAREHGLESRGYNGVDWPGFAIFTGSYVEDTRVWDGDCFRPTALVEFVKL